MDFLRLLKHPFQLQLKKETTYEIAFNYNMHAKMNVFHERIDFITVI